MLTLIGSLLGGLFRLAPELLKLWTAKDDKKHELAMLDKQIEADKLKLEQDKLRSENTIRETQAQGQVALDAAGLQALVESIKIQGQITGIKWIDGLNAFIRPFLTLWWAVLLYTVALACRFYLLLSGGKPTAEAFLGVWGENEQGIVSSIFMFWFLDRVIRNQEKR